MKKIEIDISFPMICFANKAGLSRTPKS